VKKLDLSEGISLRIVYALQKLDEEDAPRVLPLLQVLILEGSQSAEPVPEAIGKFAAGR